MTEIEKKDLEIELLTKDIQDWHLHYNGRIHTLITTIESQKEEIEKYEQRVWKEQLQLGESVNFRLAQGQIESLKAITELAVKGLKEISSKRPVNCDWETDDYYEKYCECEDISTSTLSEIERLQNG